MSSSGETAVSPWNNQDLEGGRLDARPPRVADCTLRDGEQQAGVLFSADQKVELAVALAEIGVHDLELGAPAVSPADATAIERIVEHGLDAYTSALARAVPADIDLVKSCGVDAVRLSLPISDRQRQTKLRIGPEEYVGRALELAEYAKGSGLDVIFSPYDTTRCELALLESLLTEFRDRGCVDRVRLVDTTGAATPEAIRFLVEFMAEVGEVPVEVHCHDDFGLATANTIAGAFAGAEFVSVTVNGIGERSGNAALEEVVTALALLYGLDTGVVLSELTALSRRVEQLSGAELQPHKPVVGTNSFAHESGLVVAGLLRDPFTAEAYSPELVGQTRRIVVGKGSGKAAVEAKVNELYEGKPPEGIDLDRLLDLVKGRAMVLGRGLEDLEVRQLVVGLIEGGSE